MGDADKWLDAVEQDPFLLPWDFNAWDIMEKEFKKAFIDYAEHEHATKELKELRMKDGNVDHYVLRDTVTCPTTMEGDNHGW
jgi:hypothetical protein